MRLTRMLTAATVIALTASLTGVATASADAPAYTDYVAGPMIYPMRPGAPLVCGRSAANYPSVLAAEINAPLTDMSCGGAITANLTSAWQFANPPQTSALDAGTDLVTFSIGGNDEALFITLMTNCRRLALQPHILPNPCQVRFGYWAEGVLARTKARVGGVLATIHAQAPNARVLAVGYPRSVPAWGSCPVLGLAPGDNLWLDHIVRGLNSAMSESVAADGGRSEYVDIYGPSTEHHGCSATPWVNGMYPGPDGSAASHPTGAGMRGIANVVAETLTSN